VNEVPLSVLFTALAVLLVLSGFFSGSETGLMAINRYRLRHLARQGHKGAQRVLRLLERPDRLIGLILLGNNLVNILASSLTTLIALRLGGEGAIALGAGLLTLVILIFSEVAPKTLAALHPERVAFPAAFVYEYLLRLIFPLVLLVNALANGVLRLLGVHPGESGQGQALSTEELRTVLHEAGALIPKRHQEMLLSILELEEVTVNDIMVPRGEIVGIDLEDDLEAIMAQLTHSQHTRLPVYRENIDQVEGFLHVRNALPLLARGELSKEALRRILREPYFIPEATPLNTQLLNFQRQRRRIGLVVDEYGDIQGLVTLEDILEEIVGEFTTSPELSPEVIPQEDGSYLVDAGMNIREVNRMLGWKLPTDGPKTLNGLILEYLEHIPEPGTSLRIDGYPIEIVKTQGNAVKTVRIHPPQEGE